MAEGKDVFNSDSASKKYKVNGVDLVMKPMRLKTLRKLSTLIDGMVSGFSGLGKDGDTIKKFLDMLMDKNWEIMEILFDKEGNPMLTQSFVEDNFDMVVTWQIIRDAIEINNLGSLFPFLKTFGAKS